MNESTTVSVSENPLPEGPKNSEVGQKAVTIVREASGGWKADFQRPEGDFFTSKDFDQLIRLLEHQKRLEQREANLYFRLKASRA